MKIFYPAQSPFPRMEAKLLSMLPGLRLTKLLLAALLLGVGMASSVAGASRLLLSPEEQSFLRDHPVIRVGIDQNWPPFDYFDPLKGHQGIAASYLAEVSERLGVSFETHPGTWNTVLQLAKSGRVEMLACASSTPQRELFLHFSDPYIVIDVAVFLRKDNTAIHTLHDLIGKTVALPKGNFLHDHLQNHYPGIRLRFTASNEEALERVALGEVDAHVGNMAVGGYFLEKNIITNVKAAFKIPPLRSGFSFAVVKHQPILHGLLQKALRDMDEETHRRIRKEWVSFFSADHSPAVKLSAEERAWIRRHPILLVGTGNEWPPYDFREEGEYRGLARDYLELVSQKVGLGFDYSATDTWAGLQEQLRQGKIDLLPAIYWDEALQGELLFTDVYVEAKEFVFAREGDHALKTLEDLDGRTAVFVRGSNTLPVLKEMFPSLRIIEVATVKEAVRSLTDHKADFCIDTFGAVTHISEQLGLAGIKAAFPVDLIDTGLRMAIQRSNPLLFSILQKGLQAVTAAEREEIEGRWFGTTGQDRHKKVLLSPEEQNWIRAHPVITVAGDPNRPPFSFYDKEGRYAGILADYLARIQNRTGMRFVHRHLGSFAAALEAMKRGEIDLLDAAAYSSERLNLMDFSTEHLRIDHVIVTTKDKPVIPRIDELADREVGVVQGNLVENKLPKEVPDIRLRAFSHAEEGLQELCHGRLEAFVIDLPTLDFMSQKLGLSNLKVSGGTPYSYALYFGLKKKTPMLRTILNKALASIDLSERNEIYRRWVAFEYEAEINYGLLWRTAAILLLIMAATLFWNRRLSREIAKRIILEKELVLAKERAERATLAKSEFLANMSHEIRTPMNSVIGFADILDGLTDDPLQKSYLHSIKIGGKALLGIINDILDLSKIEAGQIKLSCENISIPLLCSETEQLFHEKMVRKNLKFILEIDPGIPPYVFLDGVRLRQILINLVGNAVKFTDQGSVGLAARRIDQVSPPGKLDIEIRVTDTGIGIPEENRERIFQTFEQQEGQDIRKYGGSGLGLSISRKLVALMNGELTVESVVGQGSVFIVTLHDVPFEAAGPEQKKAVQEQAVVEFETATLMIVDDVADNRKLVEACFRDTPVAVVEAVHGRDALETLERVMVDLVLMDLRMPVMNGYETLSRLRRDDRFKGLPIVALTASIMGEDFEKLKGCGFNGYLRKPVEKKKLLEEAARFLPHRRIQKTSPPEGGVLSFRSAAVRDALADRLGGELLDEWNRVREGGDMEPIRLFNERLKAAALQNDVPWLLTYTDRLAMCIESFDLAEIFLLMNQYPDIVAKVKTAEVSADGR